MGGVSPWGVVKPLISEAIDQDPHLLPRGSGAFYPAALPVSSQTLTYIAGVIRRHRAHIGSPWRKLSPGRQDLLALAYLRKGETFAELAAGFGVGTATAWRYASETVALLAIRSSKLHRALAKANEAGHAYVVIDGT
jgi:Helix-turn-helix of DDE superfamily endonuclease